MTGIILAGGKSKRFGRDKAFVYINDKPFIEVSVAKLSKVFDEILIVVNNRNKKDFEYLGINIVTDIIPEKGPMGGIHTGLINSKSEYNFITACDMPFLNEETIKDIICDVRGYDTVVPRTGNRLHPLYAVYSKKCIPVLEENIKNNKLKLIDVLNELKTKYIDIKKEEKSFINVNTKEDYEKIN